MRQLQLHILAACGTGVLDDVGVGLGATTGRYGFVVTLLLKMPSSCETAINTIAANTSNAPINILLF